ADSIDVVYEKKKEGNKIIHEWKSADIKKTVFDNGAPSHLHHLPHIVYYIKNYTHSGKKENILESVEDLHAYYSKLVKNINQEPYEPLRKITDSLVANLSSEEEKIKTVYY